MFLLPSIGLGIAFALLLGGRPARLLEVTMRFPSLVVWSLAVQVPLFTDLGARLSDLTQHALHVGSYGLLVAFAVLNLRVRPLLLALIGTLLNAAVIVANGGEMSLSPGAARASGTSGGANVSEHADRLRFLGDVFALPGELPFATAFSVGDVLIGVGIAAFIVAVSLGPEAERGLAPGRLLQPLRDPGYRRLAGGSLLSNLGDWLTLAALVGWVYQETRSTGNVAAMLLVRLAPPILGGGLAALVVDRLPKERLLVRIELLRGATLLFALAGVVGDNRAAVLAALGLSGALAAATNAAAPALLPSLLPADRLPAGNACLGMARDAAMALGAIAAGLTLSLTGVVVALVVDLATFALAAQLFAGLRVPPGALDRRAGGAFAGIRYLLSSRLLVILVGVFASATLATGLVNATLARFLEDSMSLGAGSYGFGLGAIAVGLAAGQAIVGFSRIGPGAGRWIGAALLLMAGLFVLLAMSDHAPTALLLLAAIGFVDGTTDVVFETVVQREGDPRHLGAVFGLASAAITTTMMMSIGVAPMLNSVVDSRWVVAVAAGILAAAGTGALAGMRAHRTVRGVLGPVGSP
jgi:hypothetical protein